MFYSVCHLLLVEVGYFIYNSLVHKSRKQAQTTLELGSGIFYGWLSMFNQRAILWNLVVGWEFLSVSVYIWAICKVWKWNFHILKVMMSEIKVLSSIEDPPAVSSHGIRGKIRKTNSLEQALCNGANLFTGTQFSWPKYLSKGITF